MIFLMPISVPTLSLENRLKDAWTAEFVTARKASYTDMHFWVSHFKCKAKSKAQNTYNSTVNSQHMLGAISILRKGVFGLFQTTHPPL